MLGIVLRGVRRATRGHVIVLGGVRRTTRGHGIILGGVRRATRRLVVVLLSFEVLECRSEISW